MSTSLHCSNHSSNGIARASTSSAKVNARSSERFVTRKSLTPRERNARAVRSLVSPAPTIRILRPPSSPKIFCARSTATEPLKPRQRYLRSTAHLLGYAKRALKKPMQIRSGAAGFAAFA